MDEAGRSVASPVERTQAAGGGPAGQQGQVAGQRNSVAQITWSPVTRNAMESISRTWDFHERRLHPRAGSLAVTGKQCTAADELDLRTVCRRAHC